MRKVGEYVWKEKKNERVKCKNGKITGRGRERI